MSLRLKPLLLLLTSLPMQAHASFMPAHLIDGFANWHSPNIVDTFHNAI
jgi:hypothetical protein